MINSLWYRYRRTLARNGIDTVSMFIRPLILASLLLVFGAFSAAAELGFLVASVIICNILVNGVVGTAFEVRNDMTGAKLDVISLAPKGLWGYLRTQSYVQCTAAVVQTIPIWLAFGWTFDMPGRAFLEVIALTALLWVIAVCLSILAGARTLASGSFALVSFVIGIAIALGGAYYPIGFLPEWLQWVARGNPVTYVVDAVRVPITNSDPFMDTTTEIAVMIATAVVLVAAIAIYTRCHRWDLSRLKGTV